MESCNAQLVVSERACLSILCEVLGLIVSTKHNTAQVSGAVLES